MMSGSIVRSLRDACARLCGRRFWSFLALLLVIDAVLVAAHFAWSRGIALPWGAQGTVLSGNRWFNLGQERGYAEMKEFVEGGLAVALLLLCARRFAEPVFAGLGLAFALVVGDNLLQVHERVGVLVSRLLGAGQDSLIRHAGELFAFAMLGLVLVALVVTTYRASSRDARTLALPGMAALLLLGGFAVGVDALHALATGLLDIPAAADDLLTALEDGGETVAISAGLAYSLTLFSLEEDAVQG